MCSTKSYSDGPPYPDRIHQSVLVFDLVDRLTRAVVEWADSAETPRRRLGVSRV